MCKNCADEFWKGIEELKGVKGFNKISKPLGDKPYENLEGMVFGKLTALRAVGRNKGNRVLWLCKCSCGNSIITIASDLKANRVKSCGCLSKEPKFQNLEGKVFTRWTVLKDEGGDKVFCRCECGTERLVSRSNLKGKVSTSCGCLRKELFHELHKNDLTGKIFGRLTVLGLAGRDDKNKKLLWRVRCTCGTEKVVPGFQLLSKHSQSCGCLKREQTIERCTKPMIGKTFGRLIVLEKAYTKKGKGAYYKCQCSCGNIVTVQGSMLRSKNTRSCGCLKDEKQQKFEDLSGRRFGKLVVVKRVLNEGKGHGTRFLCKCDCGGTTITSRYSLISHETMSCGCLNSKGEFKVAQILKENNIYFEKQKVYKDLRTSGKYGAPKFDFYIPEENYLIEYDGEQHFKYSNMGWNDKEHYEKVVKRDQIKNDYCRKKSIPLIRIPYTRYDDLCIEDLKLETTKFRVI